MGDFYEPDPYDQYIERAREAAHYVREVVAFVARAPMDVPLAYSVSDMGLPEPGSLPSNSIASLVAISAKVQAIEEFTEILAGVAKLALVFSTDHAQMATVGGIIAGAGPPPPVPELAETQKLLSPGVA